MKILHMILLSTLVIACNGTKQEPVKEFTLGGCINGNVQPFTYNDGDENPGFNLFIQGIGGSKEGEVIKNAYASVNWINTASVCSVDLSYTKKSANTYAISLRNVSGYKINPQDCLEIEGLYEMKLTRDNSDKVILTVID